MSSFSQHFFTFSTQTVHTQVKDATPNIKLSAFDLYALIAGDFSNVVATNVRERVEFAISQNAKIKTLCEGFEDGKNYKEDLKQLITPLKTNLPYILPSGFCSVHHSDTTLEYNGVVQLDIDIKRAGGAKEAQRIMLAIKSLSAAFPYILLAAISPTGYGIKIFVSTSNTNISNHREAFEQVCTALCNALQIQRTDVDTLGVSQPCFVMSDPKAYFNAKCTAFVVKEAIAQTAPKQQFVGSESTENAEKAVQYIVENKIDLGFEYHEFISFSIGLVNVFGEAKGRTYANDVFSTSPKYNNDSRKYINKLKVSEHREVQVTAGTIIFYAKQHGFKPTYDTFIKSPTTIIKGEKGEYLTEILSRLGTGLTIDNICNRKWVVPTGTGKSYLVATFAKTQKVVVVCPSTALVNQYVTYGAVAFDQKRLKVSDNDTFIAVTYASVAKLGTRINTSAYHLFFDECHNFTSGDFMRKDLHKAANQIQFYQSLTQLTATNLYNFYERLEMPTMQVIVPKPHKDFHIVECVHIFTSVVKLLFTSATKERLPVILLNNTTNKLAELKTLIGDFKGLYTLSSSDKEKDLFYGITKDKLLPNDLKALITTTVIKEGNDIMNEYHYDIFVVGAFHSSDIEQFASRFRKALSITVYQFKASNRTENDRNFDVMVRAKSILRSAERSVLERNSEFYDMDLDTFTKEQNVRNAMQDQAIKEQGDGSGLCELDSIKINNIIFNHEKYHEYQNDAYQIEQLAKYNFIHITKLNTAQSDKPTDAMQNDIKEAAKASKEAAKLVYKNCLESIIGHANPNGYFRELANTKLPKAQQKAIERISQLNEKLGVSVKDAATALCTESDGELLTYSDLEFNRFATRAQLQALENNTAYMASNRKLAIVIKAMRHEISIGEKYSGEKLREIVVKVLSIDKSIDLYPFKASGEKSVKQRIMKIVVFFFDVEYKLFKENGEVARYFVLSKGNSFFNYIGLKSKEKLVTLALEKAVWKAAIDDTTVHLDTNDGWDNVPKKTALKGK